ncbi:unnamed protein product [Dovyalis caffra]|uniref:Uncharacterized protein n=1 Tax=Dovyalis caffra TaxID=77055 RepID=A0AAV1RWY6_9ROSI|nr:unnamed protein product [Dovyalis caffra]
MLFTSACVRRWVIYLANQIDDSQIIACTVIRIGLVSFSESDKRSVYCREFIGFGLTIGTIHIKLLTCTSDWHVEFILCSIHYTVIDVPLMILLTSNSSIVLDNLNRKTCSNVVRRPTKRAIRSHAMQPYGVEGVNVLKKQVSPEMTQGECSSYLMMNGAEEVNESFENHIYREIRDKRLCLEMTQRS